MVHFVHQLDHRAEEERALGDQTAKVPFDLPFDRPRRDLDCRHLFEPANRQNQRHDDPHPHRHDQVDKDGEEKDREGDEQFVARGVLRHLEEAVVENVDPDFDQDPGKDTQRHIGGERPEAEKQRKEKERMDDPRKAGLRAGFDVDHGPHRRARSGQSAEKGTDGVPHPLAEELLVGLVAGAGERIGDERGEERVDRPQEGHRDAQEENLTLIPRNERGHMELRQPLRDRADARNVEIERHRKHGEHDKRGERRRNEAGNALWHQEDECERCCRQGKGRPIEPLEQQGQVGDRLERALPARGTDERSGLEQNDDHPDAGHEARDHGVGDVADQ